VTNDLAYYGMQLSTAERSSVVPATGVNLIKLFAFLTDAAAK